MSRWKLTQEYSWGESEEPQYFPTWEEAATVLQFNAMQELLIAGQEHEWQVSLYVPADIGFEKGKRSSMEIHYEYDDTYLYYVIERA